MCRRMVSHSRGGTRPLPTRTKNRSRCVERAADGGLRPVLLRMPVRWRRGSWAKSPPIPERRTDASQSTTEHCGDAHRQCGSALSRQAPARTSTTSSPDSSGDGAPRCLQPGRGDSPGMCAMSAMMSSAAHAGNATPCVPRRQFPASVTRRGMRGAPQRRFSSAKRPTQIANLRIDARSSRTPRTPPPTPLEPIAMPAVDGGWLNQPQRVPPLRPHPA